MDDPTFSSKTAASLSGATYRQLDYWCRMGFVSPHHGAAGSGSRRRWTLDEVAVLAVLARLGRLRRGGSLGIMATAVTAHLSIPLGMWPDRIVVDERGRVHDDLRTGVLVDLAQIRADLQAAITARAAAADA